MSKVEKDKIAVISIELKNKVDEIGFTRIQYGKAIYLLNSLLNQYMVGRFDTYIPLARNYFRKVFNDGRYYEWFGKLVDAKILIAQKNWEGNNIYYKGHCTHYKINPKLLSKKTVSVAYTIKKEEQVVKFYNENWDADFIKQEFLDLRVTQRAFDEAERAVEAISVDSFILNDAVTADSFWVLIEYTGWSGYISKANALKAAKKHGADLIQDKDNFYIHQIDSYLSKKKMNVGVRYATALNKIKAHNIFVSRNETNTRLDHNLTSLNKNIIKIIKEDNGLAEIDLACSQFCILAYIMGMLGEGVDNDDYKLFKKLVGKQAALYQYVADYFKISLSKAKVMMMMIAFPSHKYNSADKKKLQTLFPTVIAFIDDYKKYLVEQETDVEKKKDAHKLFAVMLQTIEARLFVDHFYRDLKIDGVWCITKHDSLIVKIEDVDKVMEYLKERTETLGMDCTFRTDAPVKKVEPEIDAAPIVCVQQEPIVEDEEREFTWAEWQLKFYSSFKSVSQQKEEWLTDCRQKRKKKELKVKQSVLWNPVH